MLPDLPESWEPTRSTLHAYAHAVGIVPRVHALAHPKWWHVSLEVMPTGLVTDAMTLPSGGSARLRMDLRAHEIVFETSDGGAIATPMATGATATEVGDRLIQLASSVGLDGDYPRERFENDDPRKYAPEDAERFFDALVKVDRIFRTHRAELEGDVGPVQLWPHNFDLAFEWFGTRVESYEEGGEVTHHPSQLNLGFYVKDAYFYSNPWPFEADELAGSPLPHGAQWHTDGWEGSILPYRLLAGDPDGATKLAEYAAAVHAAAAPTLMA